MSCLTIASFCFVGEIFRDFGCHFIFGKAAPDIEAANVSNPKARLVGKVGPGAVGREPSILDLVYKQGDVLLGGINPKP